MNPIRRRIHLNGMSLSVMLNALVSGRQTYADLKTVTGLHEITLQKWMRDFRRHSLVHISGWRPDSMGRCIIPEFSWSPGATDAERPATNSGRIRRLRDSHACSVAASRANTRPAI